MMMRTGEVESSRERRESQERMEDPLGVRK